MSIFQVMAVLFALAMTYVVTVHKKKSTLSTLEVSFWYSIWIIFIVISLFPNLLLGIAHALHFARVFDLLVVVAFMILTLLIVLGYLSQRETDRKIEKLVRQQTLQSKKNDS